MESSRLPFVESPLRQVVISSLLKPQNNTLDTDYIHGWLNIHYREPCPSCVMTIQQVHGIRFFPHHIKCENCTYTRRNDDRFFFFFFEIEAERPFSIRIPLFKLPISLDEMSFNADLGRIIPPTYLERTLNGTWTRIYSLGDTKNKNLINRSGGFYSGSRYDYAIRLRDSRCAGSASLLDHVV